MLNYLANYFKVLILQKSKKGQAMVEYALIIALIAVLLITSLTSVKTGLSQTFTNIVNGLKGA